MATEPVGRSNFARGREVWYGEALRPTRAGEEDGERKALLRHRVEVRVRCALRAVTILMLLHCVLRSSGCVTCFSLTHPAIWSLSDLTTG